MKYTYSSWQIVLQLLSSSLVKRKKISFPFRPLFNTQLFCPITRPQGSCLTVGPPTPLNPGFEDSCSNPHNWGKVHFAPPHNNERILLYYRKQHWSTLHSHHSAVKEDEGFFARSCFHYFMHPFFLFPQIFGSQACQIFWRGIIIKELNYNVSENEVAALQQRALLIFNTFLG